MGHWPFELGCSQGLPSLLVLLRRRQKKRTNQPRERGEETYRVWAPVSVKDVGFALRKRQMPTGE